MRRPETIIGKLAHVVAGLGMITVGISLIWHERLWGLFPVVLGMTVATRPWGPRGNKPWAQGDGGGASGGEGWTYDGGNDGGGDGGGGD